MPNIRIVPQFLTARTKEELIEAMVAKNVADGVSYNYGSPTRDGANWCVWYNGEEVSRDPVNTNPTQRERNERLNSFLDSMVANSGQ